MLHFCTMTQASILCAVVLCVWISVVTAADGPGYIKVHLSPLMYCVANVYEGARVTWACQHSTSGVQVADFATKEATTNIVSLGAVLHVALNDDSVPNIDNHDDHTEWYAPDDWPCLCATSTCWYIEIKAEIKPP